MFIYEEPIFLPNMKNFHHNDYINLFLLQIILSKVPDLTKYNRLDIYTLKLDFNVRDQKNCSNNLSITF